MGGAEEKGDPFATWARGRKQFLTQLALVVAVLAAAFLVVRPRMGRVGGSELDETVGHIELAEPGWKYDDIEAGRRAREPLRERNSVPVFDAVLASIPPAWDEWRRTADWLSPGAYLSESYYLPGPERVTELRKQGEATVATRELALTLRDRPGGYRALALPENPLSLRLQHLDLELRVATLLHHDSLLAAIDRNPDRGLRAAHAVLNASRSIGDEPNLISQLSRIAGRYRAAYTGLQTLALGTPKVGLAEFQAACLEDAEEPLFLHAVRGERAALHKLFEGLEAGRIDLGNVLPTDEWRPFAPKATATHTRFLVEDHTECLRLMTRYAAAAQLPWHEQRAAVQGVLPEGAAKGVKYSITRRVLPAWLPMVDAGLRSRARLLALGVAVACERFRQHNGRWPMSLAELPTSLLAAVPANPFDNKPMRYRIFPEGISVSCFARDDTVNTPVDADFAEPGVRGFAEGVRLWNPELRGLPAPPRRPAEPDQEQP